MRDLVDRYSRKPWSSSRVAAHRRRQAWPGRRRPPRACARRAGAGRGTSRRGRARAPRRPPRSGRRAARRRSRRARRCARTGRRARARGTARRPSCRSFRFAFTAKTPSTTRSSTRSEITAAESKRVASAPCPAISPFRALRYDEAVAGPLDDLVAPPYDVIDDDRSPALLAHEPVQHRPPDAARVAEEAAGASSPTGASAACCARRSRRSGGCAQEFDGPRRRRAHARGDRRRDRGDAVLRGQGAAARAARTRRPKEDRLRLLRATRTQLEPIFLLYDADPPVERPEGEPEMRGRRGRRAHAGSGGSTPSEIELDVPLLIADGHHRYETAVAFREEEPSATHTFAVLVSSALAGLEIFPTHRVVAGGRRRSVRAA